MCGPFDFLVLAKTTSAARNGNQLSSLAVRLLEAREVPAPIETQKIDGKAIAAQVLWILNRRVEDLSLLDGNDRWPTIKRIC